MLKKAGKRAFPWTVAPRCVRHPAYWAEASVGLRDLAWHRAGNAAKEKQIQFGRHVVVAPFGLVVKDKKFVST